MSQPQNVSLADLHAFCHQAMRQVGADADDATLVADALVTTDSWGVFTHGTKLLFDYLRRVRAGGMRLDVRPEVVRGGPAWAIMDGQAVMGQIAGVYAMREAIARARQSGIAYVGMRNTNHFGAAGYYSWLAAQAGLIGISMANDIPSVAAPGSLQAVTGSNPLSYGLPTGPDTDPILLDMAISTVAGGKVYAAHQRGESIPNNWIIGPDGHPTTDGSLYPHHAALQPMSGAKGYGIAVLIEALSGVLTGAGLTWQIGSWIFADPSLPTHHGAAFIAIDVQAILPVEEYQRRIRHVVDEIHAAPTVAGVDRVLLPGEREWQQRRRAIETGINLPADVVAKLTAAAELVGLSLPFARST